MGGKSAHYRPVKSKEEDKGSIGSDAERESLPGSSEVDPDEEEHLRLMDNALDVDNDGSQQVPFPELLTQRPMWDQAKEEAQASAEAELLFPEGHIIKREDLPRAVLHANKKIHVSELQWDTTCSLGQVRALNNRQVEHYVARLKARPPRRMIRILVRATAGIVLASTRR